jgi:tetratricopeptide (TPR) repeat protein/TolB-like protein/DNA-binding winged helix-turn-helix (wHTH) protein
MDKSKILQGFYLRNVLVEPLRGQVSGNSRSAHLPPKAVEVLVSLAAEAGEVVTRECLLEQVWGKDRGSHEALSRTVSEIRHALDDHHDDPVFIQTLPMCGYRLLVKPTLVSDSSSTIVIGSENGVRVTDLGFLENLKQRGVLETGLAYLVLGWLIIQVADIVFGQLYLPDWVGTFVTVLVITGFPIALILSWFLEFRDGRAIVHKLTPSDARRRRFGRTYLSIVFALAFAGALVFIYDRSIGLPKAANPTTTSVAETFTLPPVFENSIAVLPFLNIDGSPATQIFTNGLVDSVINRLTRVPGLMVSARGDSYTLDPNTASGKVRERLRVAMYLEGSVEAQGDEIRVIVQLIDSETGFHVLSRSFDRPREDFFAIRDEITELTVSNVRVALPADIRQTFLDTVADPDIDTFLMYRRGIEALRLPATKENVAEAMGWFDRALELDPEYAAAHAGRCSGLVRLYEESGDSEYFTEAEKTCSQALLLNPNLDVVHLSMGYLLRRAGKYAEAESAYMSALQINQRNVSALIGLANTYVRVGNADAAESTFRRAIGLRPGDWVAYNSLGGFYYNSGRYAEAARQYEFVTALDQSNHTAYSNLGTTRTFIGEFDKAISAFETALDIKPRASTYSNLGMLYYYTERLDEAIANHRRAIELRPSDHLAWSNLGDALWIGGRPDESREAFETARILVTRFLEVNANDAMLLSDRAWILTMLDETAAAREFIRKAQTLAPEDPHVSYIDGLMRLRDGKADDAIEALQAAVDKGYSAIILAAEPHLAALHDNEAFRRLVGTEQ